MTFDKSAARMTVGQKKFLDTLRQLHAEGKSQFSAEYIAERLWPDGRNRNSNGQVFHLSAGVAGRMLKRCPAVWEVRPRVWETTPERLKSFN